MNCPYGHYPGCQTNYFECWCESDRLQADLERDRALARPIPLRTKACDAPAADTSKYNRMRDHAVTALVEAGDPERAHKFATEWPREEEE